MTAECWVCPACGHAGDPHCERQKVTTPACGWHRCPSRHVWNVRTGRLLPYPEVKH